MHNKKMIPTVEALGARRTPGGFTSIAAENAPPVAYVGPPPLPAPADPAPDAGDIPGMPVSLFDLGDAPGFYPSDGTFYPPTYFAPTDYSLPTGDLPYPVYGGMNPFAGVEDPLD